MFDVGLAHLLVCEIREEVKYTVKENKDIDMRDEDKED